MSAAAPTAAPPARTGFGLLGAPAAWAVQGTVGAIVSGLACRPGLSGPGPLFPPGAVRGLTAILSLAALAIALAAAAASWGSWRRLDGAALVDAEAEERAPFLALAGLFVSIVFAVAIVWAALPTILVGVCGAVR